MRDSEQGPTNPADSRSAPALAALREILRPLLRFAIRRGVRLPALMDTIKAVMVEVAEAEAIDAGRRPSDSRLSVATGVHRKDVRILRAEATLRRRPRDPIVTVVGRWLRDPAFSDGSGSPRPLSRGPREDGGPGFDALVETITTDVHARSVLDALIESEAVVEGDDGLLRLVVSTYTPRAEDAALALFAANLADHAAAAEANLAAPPGARRLERSVFYNRLTAEDVVALSTYARTEGQALLAHLNRQARARQARASGRADATKRFRFGVYLFDVDESRNADNSPDVAREET